MNANIEHEVERTLSYLDTNDSIQRRDIGAGFCCVICSLIHLAADSAVCEFAGQLDTEAGPFIRLLSC